MNWKEEWSFNEVLQLKDENQEKSDKFNKQNMIKFNSKR